MLLIGLFTMAICILHLKYSIINIKMSAALPGYMGAALGLLLVFRNNSAYDKWWEARKEIGTLVNTIRNIAISMNGLLTPDNKVKQEIGTLLIAFAYALKEHLRKGVKMDELGFLELSDFERIEKADHKPNMIANIMMNKIENIYRGKEITDVQQYFLAGRVNTLVDVLGRCERIKTTPIPMAYAMLLKFFIIIYVTILPLSLVDEIGWGTIPLVMGLYYLLMSIVITAEEIEEPFGHDLNDITMDDIASKLRDNVVEILKQD